MQILITNDDGIDAPGIAILERILSREHEIFIVAPDKQHSGGSHRITFDDPVHITELAANRFSCDGTPADCTRIALNCVCPDVDWVVSGINSGANLGMDLFLSGTVAAAREATYLGTNAIAISQYVGESEELDWERTEQLAESVLSELLGKEIPTGRFWNTNLPDLIAHPQLDQLKIVECPVDIKPLPNNYRREGNRFTYLGRYRDRKHDPGTDVDTCLGGAISLSLV